MSLLTSPLYVGKPVNQTGSVHEGDITAVSSISPLEKMEMDLEPGTMGGHTGAAATHAEAGRIVLVKALSQTDRDKETEDYPHRTHPAMGARVPGARKAPPPEADPASLLNASRPVPGVRCLGKMERVKGKFKSYKAGKGVTANVDGRPRRRMKPGLVLSCDACGATGKDIANDTHCLACGFGLTHEVL